MHWCALRGIVGENQHEIANALLEAGADPNAIVPNSGSVLEWAVESGNLRLVEVLLDNGADVDLIGNTTALIVAARTGNTCAAKLLINRGADVKIKVGSFRAADYAATFGYEELLPVLQP